MEFNVSPERYSSTRATGGYMNYPARWGEYVEAAKTLKTDIDPKYSVWASRFRAAKSLTGMSFKGLSTSSKDAYYLATKITFVDTAVEAFEEASGMKVGTLPLNAMDIGYTLWEERQGELDQTMRLLTNRKILGDWSDFCSLSGEDVLRADLRFVLRAFRHLNSHGVFTPGSAGVYRSQKFRGLLLELANEALSTMEAKFDELLKSGRLVSNPEQTQWLEQLAGSKKIGELYVGHIESLNQLSETKFEIRRSHKNIQILDSENWTIGNLLETDTSLSSSNRFDVNRQIEDRLHELTEFTSTTIIGWKIAEEKLLFGIRDGFILCSAGSLELMGRFYLPQGTLPGYFNTLTASPCKQRSGAVVSLDAQGHFIYLDFVAVSIKTFRLQNADHYQSATYVESLEGFLVVESDGLTISVLSATDLEVPKKEPPQSLLKAFINPSWVSFGVLPGADTTKLTVVRMRDILEYDLDKGEFEEMVTVGLNSLIQTAFVPQTNEFVVLTSPGLSRINLKTKVRDTADSFNSPKVLCASNDESSLVVGVSRPTGIKVVNPYLWEITGETDVDAESVESAEFMEGRALALLVKALDGSTELRLFSAELEEIGQMVIPEVEALHQITEIVWDTNRKQLIGWARFRKSIAIFEPEGGKKTEVEIGASINDLIISTQSRKAYIVFYGEMTLQVRDLDTFELQETHELPSEGERLILSRDQSQVFAHCKHGYLLSYRNSNH